MKSALTLALSVSAITTASSLSAATATDADIAAQRAALAEATKDAGFGPQSPRDLSTLEGENDRVFATAPAHTEMNLCNIHFHENAEHRGGQFTTYAGNGDGEGAGTGFRYDGTLTEAELAPYEATVGPTKYGDLQPGDTIEVHYVHTTAQVAPGPTLGSCLSEAIANPQLRVEAQVFVLVNDDSALDFTQLTAHEVVDGLHQAPAIPKDTGTPILYPGSTTGPSFNTAGSPLQVTWSVRPDVAKVSISSVEAWLADNTFDETGAHGVRNLVTNPALLAPITQTGG
ncbi:delta-class carbonic anhydrase [uncultured Roseobacter sp.]|uniref:delta-class carbonic anhydrase n=1 Tax=uncultured Roseobacter sp. TaxID=114847 RepID=UPI002627EEFA|nr:delta-class carbonic anhydrase [uncultured Roseobacter sp.]